MDFASGNPGSAHPFSPPIIVGASGNANDPLTVTWSNGAATGATSPAAEITFFPMPACRYRGTPATNAWTS